MMARAGFYEFQPCRLRFGKDGRWYADDETIKNRRIADLFSRHLRRQSDGAYAVCIGAETAVVTVEDTPFVVTGAGSAEHGSISIDLNDGTTEVLDPRSLCVGEGDVLYCRVKEGSERARFLRPAYYQLSCYFSESDAGRIALQAGGQAFLIERCREEREG